MEPLLTGVTGLLVGFGFGASSGITFLVAPLLFVALDSEDAFSFTRRFWPRYFLTLGGVGLLSLVLTGLRSSDWQAPVAVGLASILMFLNLGLSRWMERLRPEYEDSGEAPYGLLHRLTFGSNFVVIVLFAWALVRFMVMG